MRSHITPILSICFRLLQLEPFLLAMVILKHGHDTLKKVTASFFEKDLTCYCKNCSKYLLKFA